MAPTAPARSGGAGNGPAGLPNSSVCCCCGVAAVISLAKAPTRLSSISARTLSICAAFSISSSCAIRFCISAMAGSGAVALSRMPSSRSLFGALLSSISTRPSGPVAASPMLPRVCISSSFIVMVSGPSERMMSTSICATRFWPPIAGMPVTGSRTIWYWLRPTNCTPSCSSVMRIHFSAVQACRQRRQSARYTRSFQSRCRSNTGDSSVMPLSRCARSARPEAPSTP